MEILSGVFEGKTTGTPISLEIRNENQISNDYTDIKDIYRPGHADYGYDSKYGFRDYRGGGRSSGRETAGRVAAGAIAIKMLSELGVSFLTYVDSVGPVKIDDSRFDKDEITKNPLYMPDRTAAKEASLYLEKLIKDKDSSGASVVCCINGIKAGVGEPVFDKLDADIAAAVMSIGAVKAVEIGDGIKASCAVGSENNDSFYIDNGTINKKTNHAGGILGGISDGSEIIIKASFKPTPSIFKQQDTVSRELNETQIEIKGRHDPIIAPRAAVVVETMSAIVIADLVMKNCTSRIDYIKNIYLSKT